MAEPRLDFLKNEAGETEGLADAGIETFRDAPYASCAREAGQNARDAAEDIPVRMTFNVIHLPRDRFPGYSELIKALRACSDNASQEKEKEFFQNALVVASRTAIPVLEIADYNTRGLEGPPNRSGTPFHSLVKATGVSTKESETAGGSFGIGKNASFAVSDLQMVLYSTQFRLGPHVDLEVAAQGKVKLVSHLDAGGVPRRATGYWGDPEGFQAITRADLIPQWMQRSQKGTSIFCMGFRESPDWSAHMTSSLIANFFVAVHRGEMTFEVDNAAFQINTNTLEGFFARDEVVAAAEKSGHQEDLRFAKQLLTCLVSPNAAEHVLEVDGLGAVRVRVLVEEGHPRRVGFVRNGMLITDNLHHFGQPLRRFPGSRDFVALVEPHDEAATKLLKRLENPAHDNFSAQRIPDPAKRATAEAAMRRLGKLLRDLIKSTTGAEQEESVMLDELGRYFGDPSAPEPQPAPDAEHDPERQVLQPVAVRPRTRRARSQSAGDEGGGAGGRGRGGQRPGTGPHPGGGQGGPGRRGPVESVRLNDMRNVVRRDPDGAARSRVLYFGVVEDGRFRLELQANGVNTPESLSIIESDVGGVENGKVVADLRSGQRYQVNVRLDAPYEGPVELLASRQTGQDDGEAA